MKKGFRAYLPYLIAAAAFVAVCLVACGTFTAETPKEAARAVCDAFFIPAVLFLGVALLGWAASKGAYDIFGYGLRYLFVLLPRRKSYEKTESYYDYIDSKNKKGRKWNPPLLITALLLLLFSAISLVIYLLI